MAEIGTPENLIEWADKIDNRLGPISGREADALASVLRAAAALLTPLAAFFAQDFEGDQRYPTTAARLRLAKLVDPGPREWWDLTELGRRAVAITKEEA